VFEFSRTAFKTHVPLPSISRVGQHLSLAEPESPAGRGLAHRRAARTSIQQRITAERALSRNATRRAGLPGNRRARLHVAMEQSR